MQNYYFGEHMPWNVFISTICDLVIFMKMYDIDRNHSGEKYIVHNKKVESGKCGIFYGDTGPGTKDWCWPRFW